MEKELARFRSLERSGLLQAKSCQAAEMVSKVPVLCRTIALCKCVNGSLGMARSLVYDEYKKLLVRSHNFTTFFKVIATLQGVLTFTHFFFKNITLD